MAAGGSEGDPACGITISVFAGTVETLAKPRFLRMFPPVPGCPGCLSAMTTRVVSTCILLIAGVLCLPSCISSSKLQSTNEASVGRQLTDLDNAYRQGVVTEKEYLKLRKAIIKKND